MSSHFHRQQGGTLLGLIIGLVAGLAIALLVALIITKSPAPFNNKPTKSEKPSTSSAQQSADPNLPLYGNKEAVKQAAREYTEAEPLKPGEQSSAASAASKNEEKWSYYLQAGAFRNTIDAENMRARLALLGYEAGISEMLSQSGTLYRVRMGPFAQVETMNRLRSKLKESGVDAGVIRNPK